MNITLQRQSEEIARLRAENASRDAEIAALRATVAAAPETNEKRGRGRDGRRAARQATAGDGAMKAAEGRLARATPARRAARRAATGADAVGGGSAGSAAAAGDDASNSDDTHDSDARGQPGKKQRQVPSAAVSRAAVAAITV